ncbi:lens fiber membrane intrinsic protein-like [Sycon ciliatum]|uniref:lens fiber membrane intrinsic protein-like n=1 Tax=Sycon ciliatum TaxID=27933 RepID=UPI0031F6800B
METLRTGLMFIALVAFLTAFGFGVMSTTTSRWYVDERNTDTTLDEPRNIVNRGLWQWCDYDGVCFEIPDEEYLDAVRAFSILSLIIALVSLGLSLMAVNEDGTKLKLVAALFFFVTALFQLIAMGVYTKEIRDMASFDEQYWGYSFRLGWAAVFLYGASGLIFLVVATFLAGSPTKVRYGHVNRT